jgi:S-layer homology domain
MKVFRNRARVLIIVLCAFTGMVIGTDLPGALKLTAMIPTAEAANASTRNALPSAVPGGSVQTCPPTTISGTIGSGSPDFPFVTGNQTSRLFRNSVESDCGTPKPSPGVTDAGIQFKFDAYTFTNTSIFSLCITVISTSTAANQLLAAAYLDSFNPANVLSNYLGDAGNSDPTRSFSFIVPASRSFVIVQSRVNNAGSPPSLAYSFRVLGLPGCEHCPPTDISGSVGTTQTEYPKASGTQTGRLFRNNATPSCNLAKPLPSVEDPTLQFSYDAFTFLNTSPASRCVTVNTTFGANNQLFTVVYLDRFNPFDVQDNYLGDAGNSNQSRSFSFTVPGHRSFIVVQHRVNNAANPTSLSYNFSVSGLLGCACIGSLNKTSESFADNGGQGSFTITIPSGCSWSVDNFSPGFVTINGAISGTGNGTINYTVAPNPGTTRRIGTIAAAGQTYTIFEGIRFNDLPVGSLFYTEIGKLSARNVTLGCGGGNYCPNDPVLREQMAAFIIRALGDLNPPIPPTQRFTDVPPTNPFYAFIDEMADRAITLGCGSGNYCPSDPVLREQMAAFIIRALGEINPPTPPNQRFNDVPPSNQFYNFIDRMAVLNITLGCSANPPLYCPSSVVSRLQMAAFLVRAFDL